MSVSRIGDLARASVQACTQEASTAQATACAPFEAFNETEEVTTEKPIKSELNTFAQSKNCTSTELSKQKCSSQHDEAKEKEKVIVTVISILSNPNLIRFATDALEKQRSELFLSAQQNSQKDQKQQQSIQQEDNKQREQHSTGNGKIISKVAESIHQNIPEETPTTTMELEIHHVIIHLKDSLQSDLKSVLPEALASIDEALGCMDTSGGKTSFAGDETTINTKESISAGIADSGSRHVEESSSFSNMSTDRSSMTPTTAPNTKQPSTKIRSSNGDDEKHKHTENSNNVHRVCLVHCAKGQSRSVSIIIAYLLSRHSHKFKTFNKALTHVRSVRPMAMPNVGFALVLRGFEKEICR